MSLKSKLSGAILLLGLIVTSGTAAFAQQSPQQSPAPDANTIEQRHGRRMRKHAGRMGEHMGQALLRLYERELNLTDAQKQQATAIYERYLANTKTQRDELRQLHEQREQQDALPNRDTMEKARQLRTEIRQATESMRTELQSILTPEQRTKLEQLRQNVIEGRGPMHRRHHEMKKETQQ